MYAKAWGAENGYQFEAEDVLVNDAVQRFERRKIARSHAKKGFPVSVLCKRKPYEVEGKTYYQESFIIGLKSESNIPAMVAKEKPDAYEIIQA